MIQWLVDQGIASSRLTAKGGGAEGLLFPDPIYAWQH
jgi:hypothetical protein